MNDVKFNASGNLVVTIVIPYEDRDVALKQALGVPAEVFARAERLLLGGER